ncbi:DNA polymerase beta domain protein region [Rhodomicrobium vannielii ATCC 17100]|uniref:DNA polymerase beta domain protein region n=2 Tax=Rhodomicrobium vannielii TaxID=1069 RepID=E3I302_RHOVT|nr:DNA polymerase beta domain protein region [Rhodomicrobium vannielii ATCC 17100]
MAGEACARLRSYPQPLDNHPHPAKIIAMSHNDIIATLSAQRTLLQARGVQHLALFGSYVRGDVGEQSDLDVLIDIDPARERFSLVDLAGIANLLTDITGIETTPVERKMVNRDLHFARRVADDIVEVF